MSDIPRGLPAPSLLQLDPGEALDESDRGQYSAERSRKFLNLDDERTLRALWLAVFASMASMRCTDSILPALSHAFSARISSVAMAISAFALGYGALQLLVGPLSQRYRDVPLITVATACCFLASLGSATSSSLLWLELSRLASGAAAAGIVPLTLAWVGDRVDYRRRQEALALLSSATIGGMIAGQWFGAVCVEFMGWRSCFLVLACLFALVTMLLFRQTHSIAPEPIAVPAFRKSNRPARILHASCVQAVLGLAFVEGALAFGALAFIPLHLQSRFSLSLTGASAVLILYGMGGMAYSLFAKYFLRTFSERSLAILGGVCFAMGVISLGAATSWIWTLIPTTLAGFGFYALHGTLQTQATQMAPEARGTAMSLFSCSLFLGQSIGVLGAASISNRYSPHWVLWIAGTALAFLSLILAWFLQNKSAESQLRPQ